MSPRDLAFVGCRLLAVYVLFSSVLSISFNTRFILQSAGMSGWSLADRIAEFAFYAIPLAFLLAITGILWWGAGWVAAKAVAGLDPSLGPASEGWSHETALSLAVVAFGLWVLIEHLPSLVAYPVYFTLRGATDGFRAESIHSLVAELVTIALALVCVLGSRRIAGTVAQLRGM